jgi:peptidoglycan/xylan/chitin deacetylase (PgdA/CDA1 family)
LLLAAGALWTWPGWLQNQPGSWPVMRSFSTNKREIWLTIDDGPGRHDTEGMLSALAAAGAQATFFVIGREAAARPALIRGIRQEGHSVGNHTFSHRSATFWCEPFCSVRHDLQKARSALCLITGEEEQFYRAPAGRWSREQILVAQDLDLISVGWSAAGGDGTCAGDLWAAMNRIVESLRPGAIVVVHQGGRTGRVEALRYLLHRLHQGGWQTVIPAPASLRSSLP